MSEINTKIFKPQKLVLDVLNSPKGETIEFEIGGNTESFIKISDKVPEDIGKAIYFYMSDSEGASFNGGILTEIAPSTYLTEGLLILTDNVDGKSKGIYFSEELYEMFKEFGVTELYLIFQTIQDFSISKKTIEGEVHPIEEKYIPGGSGGGSSNFEIDLRIAYNGSGYDLTLNTPIDKIQEAVNNGSSIRVKAVRIPYNARSTETRESQQDPIDYFYPTRIHINKDGFFTIECRDTMVDNGVTVSDTLKIGSCNDGGGTYFVEYEDYNGTTGNSSNCSVA